MTDVAVAVLRKNKHILVCQRKRGGRYALKWEFPGGKFEPEESLEQCLRRELFEELSLTLHTIDRVETMAADYEDGGTFHVSYCFVSGFDGEPKNNVFEQIRWVTLGELKQMDMLDGNKPVIASLTD